MHVRTDFREALSFSSGELIASKFCIFICYYLKNKTKPETASERVPATLNLFALTEE